MGLPVAKFRRTFCSITERAVERGCIFHSVRHDGQILIARGIETFPDGGDHSIQHAAGSHDVRTAFGMRDCHPCQDIQRLIVEHISFRVSGVEVFTGVQDPTVTMIGVFTETHIGHNHQLGDFLLDGADRLLDDSVIGEIFQSNRILLRRDPEQDHSGHTGLRGGFRFTDRFFH